MNLGAASSLTSRDCVVLLYECVRYKKQNKKNICLLIKESYFKQMIQFHLFLAKFPFVFGSF